MYAELNRAKIAWFVATGTLLALALISFAITIITHNEWSALIGVTIGAFCFPVWAMAATSWEEADEALLRQHSH